VTTSSVRVSMIESPLSWGDSTPRFWNRLDGSRSGDRGRIAIRRAGASRAALLGSRGPLGGPRERPADLRPLHTRKAVNVHGSIHRQPRVLVGDSTVRGL
jgi:hypothetical protein